mgnify:CR=1 FL=1
MGVRFFQELVSPEKRLPIITIKNPIWDFFIIPQLQRLQNLQPMDVCARRLELVTEFFSKPTAIEGWRRSVVMMADEELHRLSQWAETMTSNVMIIQHAETTRFDVSALSPMVTQFWYPVWKQTAEADLDEPISQS